MKKRFLILSICILLFGITFSFSICALDTPTASVEESDPIEYVELTDDIRLALCRISETRFLSVSRDTGDSAPFGFDLDGTGFVEWYEQLDAYYATIQTLDNKFVESYDVHEDYSATILEQLDGAIENSYENAVKISGASAKYNCHSYAWYSQNTTENTYWVDDPLNFYDNSNEYDVVTIPRAGDIICYFDEDGNNLHSGIVVFYTGGTSNGICGNSDLVYVQSKWGLYGLYEHLGDECPYPEKGAVDVHYYRRTNHNHTYAPFYDSTKQMHGKQCTGSDCGQIIWTFEQHTYERAVSYNGNSHKWVCDCGDFYLRNHNFTYAGADDSYHIIGCTDCNFANEDDHDFTYSTTYRDSLSHNITCICQVSQIVPHNQYTETSHNTSTHTLQITCCGTHTVTGIHHFEEYDSDSHTGDCTFCSYTTTSDLSHVVPYCDNGNGTHTGECRWCDYTHTEPHTYMYTAISYSKHQIECEECDEYQAVAYHIWDEGYDEDGNLITYCTDCGYTSGTSPLTADMIAKLPAEIQTATLNAPQNALQNVQSNGSVSYVIPIDDECGILYLNGKYYLIYSPADPDAELQPTPSVPTEGVVS